MDNLLVSIGQAGDKILLVKQSFKNGHTSDIKPGKERTIILHKPMAIGHPVTERKISDKAKTRGVLLGYQKTSNIINITNKNNSFILETETSFYKVEFIKTEDTK